MYLQGLRLLSVRCQVLCLTFSGRFGLHAAGSVVVCHFRCRRLRGVPASDNMSPAATPTSTSTARITRTNFTGRDYQNHVAGMSCSEAVGGSWMKVQSDSHRKVSQIA